MISDDDLDHGLRLETVVRVGGQIIDVVAATEFDIFDAEDALTRHVQALQSGPPSGLSMSKDAEPDDEFWQLVNRVVSPLYALHRRDREREPGNASAWMPSEGIQRKLFPGGQERLYDYFDRLSDRSEANINRHLGMHLYRPSPRGANLNPEDASGAVDLWLRGASPADLGEGFTSNELVRWAAEMGFDLSARSVGNTISKHPRLRKILKREEGSHPARWVIRADAPPALLERYGLQGVVDKPNSSE